MSLWILSHMTDSPSISMLRDAAIAQGQLAVLVDPSRCAVPLAKGGLPMPPGGVPAPRAVLTRLGSMAPTSGIIVARALEQAGVLTINRADALARVCDKIRMAQALMPSGVPMPETIVPGDCTLASEVAARLGPPPYIVKIARGSKGSGVMRVDGTSMLQSVIDTLRGMEAEFLVQRAVVESFGTDVRVFVLEGRAVAAMRRRSVGDEFRSNLHRGGHGTPVAIDAAQRQVAETAAAALGLDVAGVDLLDGREGPLLIEVNGSPGLAGISAAAGRNIASEVSREANPAPGNSGAACEPSDDLGGPDQHRGSQGRLAHLCRDRVTAGARGPAGQRCSRAGAWFQRAGPYLPPSRRKGSPIPHFVSNWTRDFGMASWPG